jgi:hypothetical protein
MVKGYAKNEYVDKMKKTRTKPSNEKIACTCSKLIARKDMAKHRRTTAHKHGESLAVLRRNIERLQS